MDALYEPLLRFMEARPGMPAFFAYLIVVCPAATLLHQRGHAAASLAAAALCAWALSVTPAGALHSLLWTATLASAFGALDVVPLAIRRLIGGQQAKRGPVDGQHAKMAFVERQDVAYAVPGGEHDD